MRRFPLALTCASALLITSPAVQAGQNAGCTAYVTWTPTSLLTDVPPAVSRSAYVIVSSGTPSPLSFKGGEVDITWDPPSDCLVRGSTFFSTSTNCAWLNRGSAIPVTTVDVPGHYRVSWGNSLANIVCTSGIAARVQFDASLCTGGGCLSMNTCSVVDSLGAVDTAIITNSILTIGGGGGHNCAATPVEPSTWWRVKSLYRI